MVVSWRHLKKFEMLGVKNLKQGDIINEGDYREHMLNSDIEFLLNPNDEITIYGELPDDELSRKIIKYLKRLKTTSKFGL